MKKAAHIKRPFFDEREASNAADVFHVVGLSGGKDSTALLLLMMEKGMPIDLVLNADTGMEFPEMYEHLAKVDEYLYQKRGIHITTLKHPNGFEWLMFEEPKQKECAILKKKRGRYIALWKRLARSKSPLVYRAVKDAFDGEKGRALSGSREVQYYIGIAADERKRCKEKVYPLVDWNVTEADALQICYEHGFDFGGLYKIYRRASCWCCPFQRIGELRKLRRHHPKLWEKLREMDRRALAQFGNTSQGKFRSDWSVEELERRFCQEEMQLSMFDLEETNQDDQKKIRLPPIRGTHA